MKDILIVDTEADTCYLLSRILKEKKYTTQYANTLSEAKAILQDCLPFLVFLDIHLPDGSGLHLIEQAINLSPAPIIVLMSAYDDASQRKAELLKRVDFFVAKPFTHHDICKVLGMFCPET